MNLFRDIEKQAIPYFSFYIFIFMAMAIFTSFINIYFQELGFSLGTIGIFTALGPMISIISQPTWGVIGDRTNRRTVLMILLLVAAIISLIIPLHPSFIFIAVTFLTYQVFATSQLPIGDSLTLQYLDGKALKYSAIRVAGSISFGAASAMVGILLGGHTVRIFYFNTFFLLITLLFVFLMKPAQKPLVSANEDETDEKEQSGFKAFTKLLKNKVVLYVYLSSFVFGLAMSFMHPFIGLRMTEVGATQGQIGMGLAIAAFSEIPIFILIDRVFGKRKPEYLLMFSAFFMTIRLLLLFFANTVYIIYLAQLTHGFSFVIHLYFSITLLHKYSPPHMKATVQTVNSMVRMGLSALLGSLGGGFLAQQIGMQYVFLILSVFVFSTCFILPGIMISVHKLKKA